MYKRFFHAMAGCFLVFAMGVAQAAEQASKEVSKAVVDSLSQARPDLRFGTVTKTPLEGIYQVSVNEQQFLYVSADGQFIIAGDMFQVRPGYLAPVQDFELNAKRKEVLSEMPDEEFLIFPAVDGKPRATVYAFTDIDCGYCRKLHLETVPGLTMEGVEVRYLAFPRAGIESESYRKIATAWCSDDRKTAMTKLKQGLSVDENVCEDNPVEAQYKLGVALGVKGTPAMVLADGTMLPGYRSSAELLRIMGLN